MTNLLGTPTWDDIYQLEVTDPAQGGPGGVMNRQAQALLNRTETLKQSVQAIQLVPGAKGDKGDPGADSTVPGPKGDKGDPGATSTVPGPKGDKGDPGANSTVPGPKGDKGDTGPAGPTHIPAAGLPWDDQAGGSATLTLVNGCLVVTR